MPPSTGVFVLRDTDTLVAMQPASFVTEDDFQALIARFPALLAGDQIDTVAPRRFLLVSREQGIADDEGAGGRWSLDHLFLDQDGVHHSHLRTPAGSCLGGFRTPALIRPRRLAAGIRKPSPKWSSA